MRGFSRAEARRLRELQYSTTEQTASSEWRPPCRLRSSILQGRIYAVVGSPGNTSANTGIAIANPNATPATITFNFTDANGTDFGSGTTVVPANGQIARFIDQEPFKAPSTLQGTLTFTSSVPVSVVALQGLTNERNEFLITTLPVTDLSIVPGNAAVTIPHFASGGGWTTQVVLVNPGSTPLTGTIQFIGFDGTSLTAPSFTVAARSSFVYQTSPSGSSIQTGSVRVVPTTGNSTPVALTIFSFKNNGVTVSQSGVPQSAVRLCGPTLKLPVNLARSARFNPASRSQMSPHCPST